MSSRKQGSVIWITGYSGSGKTTLAKNLCTELKLGSTGVVHLDGDELRTNLWKDVGYSLEERLDLSFKYSNLCKLISAQGLIVIWSGIAMFDEVRKWNRRNIPRYFEVYVKVPLDELKLRDQKKLYSNATNQNTTPVIGLNVTVEEPKSPDLVVNNFGISTSQDSVSLILKHFLEWDAISAETIN